MSTISASPASSTAIAGLPPNDAPDAASISTAAPQAPTEPLASAGPATKLQDLPGAYANPTPNAQAAQAAHDAPPTATPYRYGDPEASVAQRLEAARTGIYADGCVQGRLPDTTGLTPAQQGELYAGLMHDTVDARAKQDPVYKNENSPLHDLPQDMLTAFDNKEAVQFGMRVATPMDANNGRGQFDDRMVILQKQDDGTVKVLYEHSYNADPAGSYQSGNPNFGVARSSTQAEGSHANEDTVLDIGRLHEGVHEFKWAQKAGFGPTLHKDAEDHPHNILKSTHAEPADRHYDGQWNFDSDKFLQAPQTSTFSAGVTMYQHRGYANFTGSAGCQTFPAGEIKNMADTLTEASKSSQQDRVFYVLRNM